MYRTKHQFKSKALTVFLIFCFIVVFYVTVALFISGPYYEDLANNKVIIDQISEEHEDIVDITYQAFAFITYTVETKESYYLYNEDGSYILVRNKDTLQLDEVSNYIKTNYPSLANADVIIAYGYNNIAYYIEEEYEILVIDYDTLEEVFYMKEGI